ncbi:hypothetical protein CDD83_5907 [Cordyceps sp. RAO-2017]|nr:hypothetical protein CDD83_5907 [Cordyceps sp. RAO-2017]
MTEDKLADSFADAVYHWEHHNFDLNSVSKFALSQLAREHGRTVVITGEGSDELFCGYPSFKAEFLSETDLAMPNSTLAQEHETRQALHRLAQGENWRPDATRDTARTSSDRGTNGSISDSILSFHPKNDLYQAWVQEKRQEAWGTRETVIASQPSDVQDKIRKKWHPAHSALYLWNKSNLPNVILTCLGDRSEMAHGVEGRTPFLDHHLVEYVNALPPSVKIRYDPPDNSNSGGGKNGTDNNQSTGTVLQSLTEKWILRQAARPYVMDEPYNRKKEIFKAPSRWPRGGRMHRMFGGLLSRQAVENLGFVDYAVVEKALANAFGEDGDPLLFRVLCYTGGWVVLSKQFGIKAATAEDW